MRREALPLEKPAAPMSENESPGRDLVYEGNRGENAKDCSFKGKYDGNSDAGFGFGNVGESKHTAQKRVHPNRLPRNEHGRRFINSRERESLARVRISQ